MRATRSGIRVVEVDRARAELEQSLLEAELAVTDDGDARIRDERVDVHGQRRDHRSGTLIVRPPPSPAASVASRGIERHLQARLYHNPQRDSPNQAGAGASVGAVTGRTRATRRSAPVNPRTGISVAARTTRWVAGHVSVPLYFVRLRVAADIHDTDRVGAFAERVDVVGQQSGVPVEHFRDRVVDGPVKRVDRADTLSGGLPVVLPRN